MGAKMFIGVLLLVLGLSILINIIFKIDIPVFRVVLGIFVIYLGLKILMGSRITSFGRSKEVPEHVAVFDSKDFKTQHDLREKKSYSVVFGEGKIDLSQLTFSESGLAQVEINTVFGSTDLKLPANVPVEMEINSVAGQVTSPTNLNLNSAAAEADTRKLALKINAVFGAVKVYRAEKAEKID